MNDADHSTPGTYQADIFYLLKDIPAVNNPEILDSVNSYAAAHHYLPLSQHGDFRSYRNPMDGFEVSIDQNAEGGLSLGVDTPCVWPNGTPPPK
jgi:hypothetical protein